MRVAVRAVKYFVQCVLFFLGALVLLGALVGTCIVAFRSGMSH